MDNLLRLIRQHNIFGTEPDATPSPAQGIRFGSVINDSPSDDDYDAGKRMQELYQPEHEATDRYMSTLEGMPIRRQPSIWRRLGAAAISGATEDPRYGNQVLYAPYERDLSDWQTKVKAYEPAANLERQNNANMRSIANNIVSQEQGSRRLERQYSRDRTLETQGNERLRQGNERLTDADRRIAQADERIKIAGEVAKGGQLKVDDAGNAMIVRRDGTTLPVNGEFLSFEEKERLRAQNRPASSTIKTDVIDDPDNPGKKVLVRINSDGTYSIVKGKGTGAAAEPTTRTTPSKATEELGTSRETLNKAQSIKNSNPRWNKWVKIDKGKVEIVRPGIFSGPSEQEYQQIYNSIFGGQSSTMGGRGRGGGSNTPSIPNGKVKVKRKADGATGMMDANDPALNSGKYERIQ